MIHPQRKYKNTSAIFRYLKRIASNRGIVTYSKVEADVGGNRRSMGPNELFEIWQECDKRNWPRLNALVVRKSDGLPGDGYAPDGIPLSKAKFEVEREKIYSCDWSDKIL
jgi:hypothetical protein